MTGKTLRKILKGAVTAALAAVLIVLCASGCSDNAVTPPPGGDPGGDPTDTTLYTVMITESSEEYEILSENPVDVESGGSAGFVLRMKGDLCVTAATYRGEAVAGVDINNGADGTTTVTINDVRWSQRVSLTCEVTEARIAYHVNGGKYTDMSDPAVPYTTAFTLKNRLRPNTETGTDIMSRKGYILTGWNTEPDGSGERIGLGSRVTPVRGGTLDLYAQWAKASPVSDFEYRVYSDSVTITGYIGSDRQVVVPVGIEGRPVEKIGAHAFTGDIDSVVLPESVLAVEEEAFVDCDVRELYMFDNINYISDGCFLRCPEFSTVHVNAIVPPRFGGSNLYSEVNFADKYDLLILNKDKKKLLVYGGSGAYMSVDTVQLEEEIYERTGEEYVCLNMAVNGWFNGAAQFDMMMPYIGEDDIFIHAPESSSACEMMYELSMTPSFGDFDYNRIRLYACMESNWDLMGLIDFRHVEDLLTGFEEFNAERATMEANSLGYEDYATKINLFGTIYRRDTGWIDDRGNFALPQLPRGDRLDAGEADIIPEFVLDEDAHDILNARFDEMRAKGADVYFVPAPVNTDTLRLRLTDPDDLPSGGGILYTDRPYDIPLLFDDLGEWVEAYEEAVTENIRCKVLLPLSETLYETPDMFDADYHLCDERVPEYTGMIADALIASM